MFKGNKYLWKFHWNCGRSGKLEGLFVATDNEVNALIGSDVYFGEVLSKHSEVFGEVEDNNINKLDVPSELVEEVSKVLGDTWSGFNPMNYVPELCEICERTFTVVDKVDVDLREELSAVTCWSCYQDGLESL